MLHSVFNRGGDRKNNIGVEKTDRPLLKTWILYIKSGMKSSPET
jgi:hypothetical protein